MRLSVLVAGAAACSICIYQQLLPFANCGRLLPAFCCGSRAGSRQRACWRLATCACGAAVENSDEEAVRTVVLRAGADQLLAAIEQWQAPAAP